MFSVPLSFLSLLVDLVKPQDYFQKSKRFKNTGAVQLLLQTQSLNHNERITFMLSSRGLFRESSQPLFISCHWSGAISPCSLHSPPCTADVWYNARGPGPLILTAWSCSFSDQENLRIKSVITR